MRQRILCAVFAFTALFPAFAYGETETDRLREALRSATGQMRALEDQRTALQARISEADRERANLKLQVDAQKARAAQAEKDYRQAVEDFNARLEERNQTIEKWKDAYAEAASVARTKDAERAKFESESKTYMASSKACTAKNIQLAKVGRELMARYEGVTIGDLMAAKEPVLALRRVEIQNLLQDYKDKIIEQKVQP
ncbi:MAG: hypothetical protein WDN50_06350 [Bradyrhizobium sp.]